MFCFALFALLWKVKTASNANCLRHIHDSSVSHLIYGAKDRSAAALDAGTSSSCFRPWLGRAVHWQLSINVVPSSCASSFAPWYALSQGSRRYSGSNLVASAGLPAGPALSKWKWLCGFLAAGCWQPPCIKCCPGAAKLEIKCWFGQDRSWQLFYCMWYTSSLSLQRHAWLQPTSINYPLDLFYFLPLLRNNFKVLVVLLPFS